MPGGCCLCFAQLMPSWDLVIEEPYRVDFFITPNYPLDAPKIHIPNKEPLLPNKDLVWDRSGFLIIPLVSTDSKGWSRGCETVAVLLHATLLVRAHVV